MKNYKIGIIGCGHIAQKMAATLKDMLGVESYAAASRNKEKALAFANQWQFQNLPPRENCAHTVDQGAVHCEPPRRTHSIRDLGQRKDIHAKENSGGITVHRHPDSIRLPARSECRTGHLD